MKARYRQQLEEEWCELDDSDYGPIVAVQIELEEDEELTTPLAVLNMAGQTYTIEIVTTRYAGKPHDA